MYQIDALSRIKRDGGLNEENDDDDILYEHSSAKRFSQMMTKKREQHLSTALDRSLVILHRSFIHLLLYASRISY